MNRELTLNASTTMFSSAWKDDFILLPLSFDWVNTVEIMIRRIDRNFLIRWIKWEKYRSGRVMYSATVILNPSLLLSLLLFPSPSLSPPLFVLLSWYEFNMYQILRTHFFLYSSLSLCVCLYMQLEYFLYDWLLNYIFHMILVMVSFVHVAATLDHTLSTTICYCE